MSALVSRGVRSAELQDFHAAGDRLHSHQYTSREEFDADVAAAPGVAALSPRCRALLTEEQKDAIAIADPYAALMFLKRTAKPNPQTIPTEIDR